MHFYYGPLDNIIILIILFLLGTMSKVQRHLKQKICCVSFVEPPSPSTSKRKHSDQLKMGIF